MYIFKGEHYRWNPLKTNSLPINTRGETNRISLIFKFKIKNSLFVGDRYMTKHFNYYIIIGGPKPQDHRDHVEIIFAAICRRVLLQISLHYVRFYTRFALPQCQWRLPCGGWYAKPNPIAPCRDIVKISLFNIYMNRYLHIKVFSFVPKVDLTFILGHMSDNISYYELLQPIRYKHKYNVNIRIRIGFWVENI